MEQTCITNISKSGNNLFALVPHDLRGQIGRGDRVEIKVIQKASDYLDKKIFSEMVARVLDNPNGDSLSGTINGYKCSIRLKDLISNIDKDKIKELLVNGMTD